LKRSRKIKGPILCFIGPPGVGKTSLVKSIAEAMGRKYCKFALGGVRDEAEIRGHRRTYLGSMPGKIITLIKKTKVDNPVLLLDEIDKMSADFRGDPASALLEVLDPEQNAHFADHYLEVEYDLSNIVFIATANSYDLPRALLDRMEIINIAGYIEEEKLQIAKNHLIQKQLKLHGMKPNELIIPDETILELIRYYTKEAGVRALEREIGALARKVLTRILKDKKLKSVTINPSDLEEYLGVKKYRFGLAAEEDQIGSTTGLAYTEVGGDLLTIEAVSFPGKGGVKATGKLGEVMKESADAAYSCFLSRAKQLGLEEKDYKEVDIHIHVPEGAIPKDGPSAGIALYTTIVSLMTKKPVKKTLAMTGEITLRGKVLPIGGLKEKLLAASRGGIKTVLIPIDNVKDLKEIPENIKNTLEIIPVAKIEEVLKNALV
jgi:ATP-dependent Lon protease